MSWLFWVLLIVLVLFGIQGFRKGLLKTLISMVSTIAVIIITSMLTPQIGAYIRENTEIEDAVQARIDEVLFAEFDGTIDIEIPVSAQVQFIEELPVPQIMKDSLIENNNSEVYKEIDVSGFTEYLSKYVASALVNGVAFIIAFIITLIIMRVIVFIVGIVTELPLIGALDQLGGFAIGVVHGMFWIAIAFLVIALAGETAIGGMLVETINSDPMLSWVYDKNALVGIVTNIVS